MTKTLIISSDGNNYFFPHVKSGGIRFASLGEGNGLIIFTACRIIRRLHVNFPRIFAGSLLPLHDIDHIIVLDSGHFKGLKDLIRKYNKSCSIDLFIWNPMSRYQERILREFDDLDHTWSLVPSDCKKYGINFNTQFFCSELRSSVQTEETKYDFLFVGREKSRAEYIVQLVQQLEEANLSVKLHLLHSKAQYHPSIDEYLTNQFIPYSEYLDLLSQSRCLIDIINPLFPYYPLRVLEALFLSKKLITNNQQIRNEPFYRSNNIYVLTGQHLDQSELQDFLNEPFDHSVDVYLPYYDIRQWLQRFWPMT